MIPNRPCRAGKCGFTLIETMVVLAIAAILLAVGVPNLRDMIVRHHVRTAVNDLFSAIDLTRSQAITRGSRVTMMPAGPSGLDWNQGWVVFIDKNGSQTLDAADELLFQQGPVAPGIAILSAFSSARPYVAYNGAGRSCSATNSMAARWGALSVVSGKNIRHIAINMLGRVRVCDPQLQPATCSGPGDK